MEVSTLKETIKLIETLSDQEKDEILAWLLHNKQDKDLSQFSFLLSHSVLKKEWLNEEEDKAWKNL